MTFNPLIDIAVVVAFGTLFAVPVYLEYRRKKKAPKQKGATKI